MYSPTRSNNFRYVCHYHLGKMYVFVNLVASFAIIQFLYKHFLLRKRRNIRNPLADDDGVRPPRGVELKMPIGRFPSPWRRERRRCRESAALICLSFPRGDSRKQRTRHKARNKKQSGGGSDGRASAESIEGVALVGRWGREGERERRGERGCLLPTVRTEGWGDEGRPHGLYRRQRRVGRRVKYRGITCSEESISSSFLFHFRGKLADRRNILWRILATIETISRSPSVPPPRDWGNVAECAFSWSRKTLIDFLSKYKTSRRSWHLDGRSGTETLLAPRLFFSFLSTDLPPFFHILSWIRICLVPNYFLRVFFFFFFLFINTRFERTERIALESESVSKGLAHRQFNGNDRVVL